MNIDDFLDVTNSAESRETIESEPFKLSNLDPDRVLGVDLLDPREFDLEGSFAIPLIRVDENGSVQNGRFKRDTH